MLTSYRAVFCWNNFYEIFKSASVMIHNAPKPYKTLQFSILEALLKL